MRFTKKILILIPLLIFAASAAASGVKVNPPKLEITSKLNESVTREITVANPTSDVQLFKVYPDNFSDVIKANPSSFTLEAGAERTVAISIETKNDQKNSTSLSTNLSVVAKPLAETQFSANAGIKVPVSITISTYDAAGLIPKWQYYLFVLAAALGSGGVVHLLRQRRTAEDGSANS